MASRKNSMKDAGGGEALPSVESADSRQDATDPGKPLAITPDENTLLHTEGLKKV